MFKLIRSLLSTTQTITRTYSNSTADRLKIRRAIQEGFTAVWTGFMWILTKVVG